MRNPIVNGIYGRRISGLQASIDTSAEWILPECRIGPTVSATSVVAHLAASQRQAGKSLVVPILNLDLILFQSDSSLEFKILLGELVNAGISKIVLSIDEDNDVSRALSPRFFDEKTRSTLQVRISRVIECLARDMECLVALVVEELCPGGLDPTDGIDLATHFSEAGAKGIIASGGSVDFPMLKNRRPTTQKAERELDQGSWPETWMSSSLWLAGLIKVPVFAQGPVKNIEATRAFASELGLAGVIDVSVKHPSSLWSMAR